MPPAPPKLPPGLQLGLGILVFDLRVLLFLLDSQHPSSGPDGDSPLIAIGYQDGSFEQMVNI